MSILWLLLIPAFSFLYRCRGGYIPMKHLQVARLVFWAVPIAVAVTVSQGPLVGLAAGVMAFAGLLIPHAEFQNDASIKSVLGMSGIGLVRLGLILAPAAYVNQLVLLVLPIGLCQGFAEYAGWKYLSTKKLFNLANTGSGWQELLTGAFFGLALALLIVF